MTGIPEFNYPAFIAEATRLRALGYSVVSPAEVTVDTSVPWELCLRADIKAMMDCEAIALMPGWQSSKGAHLEVHIAHRVGLPIHIAVDLQS